GAPFAHPPAGPIRLCWDPRTRGAKKPLYTSNIPLMHRGLLDAMRSAGIDNIDAYPAEVLDLETQEVDGDYVAFNVLGAVRAADLARSHWADPSQRRRIDMDFDSLAIAPDASRGLLLFRLAECVSGLVVHHALRR